MKTFDTLYKRTKTGAIQYWKIFTTEDIIHKESGQLETDSPIQHQEVCIGKNIGKSNETTPAEQAVLQAESDWKRKHDEGYKTSIDVLTAAGISDAIWNQMSMAEWLEKYLPKFNTDASGNVKPMLAKDWNGGKNVKYPCFIQPKLDGVRCLMIVETSCTEFILECTTYSIEFLSRSGKKYTTLDHIKADVLKYIDMARSGTKTFTLDGEIYSDELTFQEITQAVKKQYPNSLKLHFRAYDIVNDKTQMEREQDVFALVQAINSPFISKVETYICYHGNDTEGSGVKWYHDKWVQAGYEGAMLRLYNGHYAQGQRSSHLLKVKEFDETEFEFLNWETGAREEDLIAVCFTEKGAKFKAKMVGTREQKERLRESMSGDAKLTVKHFGWTDDGLPRFPIGKSFRNYE